MKPAPLSATQDLMTLFRLIGEAMRAAGPSGFWMQVLLIGTMSPRLRLLLEAWLIVEERCALAASSDEAWYGEAWYEEAWCEEDDGEMRSGWISREGPVWRWRQVTRFGSVLVIPVLWFIAFDDAAFSRRGRGRVWAPAWSALPAVRAWFLLPGLAMTGNCDVFVPVS